MDWGLAKVTDRPARGAVPVGAPDVGGSGAAHTVAGRVKGTPAYMAPEQARGEPVDARADVFALGGLLLSMLTGRPPFTGDTVLATVMKAAMGEVTECFAAVDACGADPELREIVKRCMAPAVDARYADGREVAAAVIAYKRGAERRMRRAKRARAAAEARAEEAVNTRRETDARIAQERKARRLRGALAATAVAVLLAAGGTTWLFDHRVALQRTAEARLAGERDAEARLKADQAKAGVRAGLALATQLRQQYKFAAARAAIDQAATLADGGAPDLAPDVAQARQDLAVVVALDGIRLRSWVWTPLGNGHGRFDTGFVPGATRAAFTAYGLDPDVPDPAEVGGRVARSAVRAELVAGIDVWALFEPDAGVRSRLLAVARRSDPGSWTDRFRTLAVWADKAAVARLADDADPTALAPATLAALAALMDSLELDPGKLLATARAAHPNDFGLALALGNRHAKRGDEVEKIGPYEAARALRPDNLVPWVNLGAGLVNLDKADAGLTALRRALELDPTNPLIHQNIGLALQAKGDQIGALAAHRRALALDPKYATAQDSIGVILARLGDKAGSLAAHRRALELDPKDAMAHYNVGVCLGETGDVAGAVAAYRESIRLDSTFAMAHYNLGVRLDESGDRAGALAAYRRAVGVDPKFVMALNNLGWTLADTGAFLAAAEVLERAVRLDPHHSLAHTNLAWALSELGDDDRAIVLARRAVVLDPCLPLARYHLAWVLNRRGDESAAISAYRQALEVDPEHVESLTDLGGILSNRGERAIALDYLRRAVAADPAHALARNNLGWTLMMSNALDAGIVELRKAVELDPALAIAYHNLGMALQQKLDTQGASAAYERAVANDPTRTYSHINLGVIRLGQKRLVDAETCARAAIRSDRRNADAHALLGFVLEANGDLPAARVAAAEAARLNPTKWSQRLRDLPARPAAPPPREVMP